MGKQLGVTEPALRAFFAILERQVPLERWAAGLMTIVSRHRQAVEDLHALEPEELAAADYVTEARVAVEAGDYGNAEQLLDLAEELEMAGFRVAEDRLHQSDEVTERRCLSSAGVLASKAEIFMIQCRYRDAADEFAAAAERLPADEHEQRRTYQEKRGHALRQGGETGAPRDGD